MRIAVDVMGGDHPPQSLSPAVVDAAIRFGPEHSLTLIATEEVIRDFNQRWLAQYQPQLHARVDYCLASDIIQMGDDPVKAARQRKSSSLVSGIRLIKKHLADAFVTAGNTGALIACATLSLPLLPGVNRPALLATLPTEKGFVAIIDVGGNVYCKAHHLVKFAQMGAAYQRCSQNIEVPRVGLLNIGVESKKGTNALQQAYEILKVENPHLNSGMKFVGNVEGRDLFSGNVDVLVTDGFTGNIVLKIVEGTANFIIKHLKQNCPENTQNSVNQALEQLNLNFNYSDYPGAIVCGVEGVIVKCHGDSTAKTLLQGIEGAFNLVQKRLVHRIKEQIKTRLAP